MSKARKKWTRNQKILAISAMAAVVASMVPVVTLVRNGGPEQALPPLPEIKTPRECPGRLPDSTIQFPVMMKYNPSGLMGDVNDITVERKGTSDVFRYEPRGIGKHEWEWKYVDGRLNPAPAKFAGVMYLEPPNNWGREYGGWKLSELKGVIRWTARSLKGTIYVEFVIGGVRWVWDDKKTKMSPQYPDSMPRTSLGVKELAEEWQTFEFSLRGHPSEDFLRVLGGFAWIITWDSNGVKSDKSNKASAQWPVFEIELRDVFYERR